LGVDRVVVEEYRKLVNSEGLWITVISWNQKIFGCKIAACIQRIAETQGLIAQSHVADSGHLVKFRI
jgi:hypothetical protein